MAAAIAKVPVKDTARDAAPTLAVISVVSLAFKVTLLAEIPVPSPSMNALISAATLFSATAPAPTKLRAKFPLAAIPNAPAPTSAVILFLVVVAVALKSPLAVMLEFSM